MNFKNSLMLLGIMLAGFQTKAANTSNQKHYTEVKTMAQYDTIMHSVKPQIVKFYTNSCGACKVMEPIFNNVANKENAFADFSAINVEDDAFKDLIGKHSLVAVPTTLYIKSGSVIKTDKGSMNEADFDIQVKSFIKK